MALDEFQKFRELLEKSYLFPASYLHKFVGRNSPAFHEGVREFEEKFVGLKRASEKKSASGEHIALTYSFTAGNAEDIVDLSKATHRIPDILFVL